MLVRENVPQIFFVGIGHRPIREDAVHFPVIRVAGFGSLHPFMLVRGVIDNQIQHQADALLAQFVSQTGQLLHAAQRRMNLSKAADGITTIIFAVWHLKQRHQM